MAGVKVTDLTPLGAADPTDIMYIVDAAANQSKQIQVQNIYDGLPQFASGSFTPTVSGETFSEIVSPLAAYYSRVDNVVNCTYFLDVALDTGQTQAAFELSLPVASNFTNVKDLVGIISHDADASELPTWSLAANTVNNTASIGLTSVSTQYNFQYIYITVQYLIVP
jgi:hypothetical protein